LLSSSDGKTVEDFVETANAFVLARRSEGWGVQLTDEHALLSRDEVLAVRLYTCVPCDRPRNLWVALCSLLALLAGGPLLTHRYDSSSLSLAQGSGLPADQYLPSYTRQAERRPPRAGAHPSRAHLTMHTHLFTPTHSHPPIHTAHPRPTRLPRAGTTATRTTDHRLDLT
jgi:hypothetical protein